VSPTAREVKGPDPSRDKVNRQAPVSWFQIFTLQSCDEVAIIGIEASALGRKTQDATVWKCPLYSHILFRVCLRSHSCVAQYRREVGGSTLLISNQTPRISHRGFAAFPSEATAAGDALVSVLTDLAVGLNMLLCGKYMSYLQPPAVP